jgi:sterol 14-demethylase
MGVLSALVGPVTSLSIVFLALGFVVLLIIANVLKQLLFKKANEPPLVFHLLPFIGSTITYGIDPVKFFFNCRQKVRVTAVDAPA